MSVRFQNKELRSTSFLPLDKYTICNNSPTDEFVSINSSTAPFAAKEGNIIVVTYQQDRISTGFSRGIQVALSTNSGKCWSYNPIPVDITEFNEFFFSNVVIHNGVVYVSIMARYQFNGPKDTNYIGYVSGEIHDNKIQWRDINIRRSNSLQLNNELTRSNIWFDKGNMRQSWLELQNSSKRGTLFRNFAIIYSKDEGNPAVAYNPLLNPPDWVKTSGYPMGLNDVTLQLPAYIQASSVRHVILAMEEITSIFIQVVMTLKETNGRLKTQAGICCVTTKDCVNFTEPETVVQYDESDTAFVLSMLPFVSTYQNVVYLSWRDKDDNGYCKTKTNGKWNEPILVSRNVISIEVVGCRGKIYVVYLVRKDSNVYQYMKVYDLFLKKMYFETKLLDYLFSGQFSDLSLLLSDDERIYFGYTAGTDSKQKPVKECGNVYKTTETKSFVNLMKINPICK